MAAFYVSNEKELIELDVKIGNISSVSFPRSGCIHLSTRR